MAYFKFENGKTALNDTNLNAMQRGLMELVYPIGSTYITQTDTNPSTILEFGTWERFKGLLSVGLDEEDEHFNTIGKIIGETEHTTTIDEMPKHKHDLLLNTSDSNVSGSALNWQSVKNARWYSSDNIKETGNGKPHNNIQPTKVVGYMWIRTA